MGAVSVYVLDKMSAVKLMSAAIDRHRDSITSYMEREKRAMDAMGELDRQRTLPGFTEEVETAELASFNEQMRMVKKERRSVTAQIFLEVGTDFETGAVASAQTGADGHFVLDGDFPPNIFIYAELDRTARGDAEEYEWLETPNPFGPLMLSNKNAFQPDGWIRRDKLHLPH